MKGDSDADDMHWYMFVVIGIPDRLVDMPFLSFREPSDIHLGRAKCKMCRAPNHKCHGRTHTLYAIQLSLAVRPPDLA